VHVLLATDANWVVDEVVAALSDAETSFTVCRNGRDVTGVVKARTPDIAILDLQIGSMGGMATAMNLRNDESSGALEYVPILMLLDRDADLHLARRSGADGWLVKPIDPMRLRRAVDDVMNPPLGAEDLDFAVTETAEEEPVPAG
jgi:DNA-binding response OmpR family regulator